MSQDHTVSQADSLRVSVLSEALPFIQRFAGRCMVVKYGGAAMVREDLREAIFRDLVLLSCVGMKVVVVHGGGPEINTWLGRLQIEPEFREGLRVTDSQTMDVVEMVLVGRLNKRIVNGINLVGGRAVGLAGGDGGLVTARTLGDGTHGLVGDVAHVDPSVLLPLIVPGPDKTSAVWGNSPGGGGGGGPISIVRLKSPTAARYAVSIAMRMFSAAALVFR